MSSTLSHIVADLLGNETATRLLAVLALPPALTAANTDPVPRAILAQSLNMVLFDDLLRRVPAAADYVADCQRDGLTITHDHGAVRTVALDGMGSLPSGEGALLRVLRPLGYLPSGVYPLERLKMIGRSYAQQEFPEEIAQFFISELLPDRFTLEFQAAVARVTSTSTDPLTPATHALLAKVEQEGITISEAIVLVRELAKVFTRRHSTPSLTDYDLLRAESAEMAWIATEGNVFNHATDRVADVQALSDEQKRLGRPMKDTVEISGSGRVRQTAFRAAMVTRDLLDEHGVIIQREVPGSFMEFIARDALPGTEAAPRLDLSFDPSNAQAIFKMTAQPR